MLSFGKKKSEGGQALLIIVLVMVVALTVGLSVATRSITSLRNTTEEANSAQALSAAEAGLERQLNSGTSIGTGTFSNNTSYNTSLSLLSGAEILLNNGSPVLQDEGADLWLVEHDSDNKPRLTSPWAPSPPGPSQTINIYWDTNSCNSSAALQIAVVSGSVDLPILTRYAYDSCLRSNNFTSVSSGSYSVGGKTFKYSTGEITITNGFIVRIIPIYADTTIGVVASTGLPNQGTVITSTGTWGTGTNQITRSLSAYQPYPSLPTGFFTYGILSTKNN